MIMHLSDSTKRIIPQCVVDHSVAKESWIHIVQGHWQVSCQIPMVFLYYQVALALLLFPLHSLGLLSPPPWSLILCHLIFALPFFSNALRHFALMAFSLQILTLYHSLLAKRVEITRPCPKDIFLEKLCCGRHTWCSELTFWWHG